METIDARRKRAERSLMRAKGELRDYQQKAHGHEQEYTFHGGYSVGYAAAKVTMLEDLLDDLTEIEEEIQNG